MCTFWSPSDREASQDYDARDRGMVSLATDPLAAGAALKAGDVGVRLEHSKV